MSNDAPRRLEAIHPRSWEHPADRAALSALEQLRGLDELVRFFVSATTERSLELMHIASSVKVSSGQFPGIARIVDELVDTFDWPVRPVVFVTQSPHFNAHTFGVRSPFIVLNSALLRSFSPEGLKVAIGHEMGHVMSGHALFKTLGWLLANVSLRMIPMAEILVYPIQAALAEWDRKSELSADRASLLAVQREEPVYEMLMRMAGGDDLSQVGIEGFFLQAQEFEARKDLLDSLHKLLNQVWASHPYPVVRLQEIRSWAAGGRYRAILDGDYVRRNASDGSPAEDMKDGYEFYRSTVKTADDPVSRIVAGIGTGIELAAEELGDRLKGLFGKP